MNRIRASFALLPCIVLATPVLAHPREAPRPARGRDWARLLEAASPHASVRDRFLIGSAHEERSLLPNGNLVVRRVKTYTHVEHPERHVVARLPEPCRVESRFELDPALRIVRSSERLHLDRSIDRVFDDYVFTEEHEDLLGWAETRVRANATGTRLTRTVVRHGHAAEDTSYAYEADDVPVEILGISLARAVARGVRRFDFDLLMPDGATHRVTTDVHHTRDLRRFGKDYRFPAAIRRRLALSEDAAVLEMQLASPVKRLLYPYKFYIAYPDSAPTDVVAFWGGKPGKHLYAFRTDVTKTAR